MSLIPKVNTKRLLIDKANATMLLVIGITSFVVIFSLIASKALLSQRSYQSRVVKDKELALKVLKDNNANVKSLVESYKSFASEKSNILEGNPEGIGPVDGDNPTLVLDALPSKYDFPGLVTSMAKLLKDGGYKIDSIGGTDDEIAQQNTSSDKPVPIEIPFPIAVTTNYQGAQNLLISLEYSIRPISINQLSFVATGTSVRMAITAKTYYQPSKSLKITSKVVK